MSLVNLPHDIIRMIASFLPEKDTRRFAAACRFLRTSVRESNVFQDSFLSYKINKWKVTFDETFDDITLERKTNLLRRIEQKYSDFDDIILRTSQNMKARFSESGKSKLYQNGIPHEICLKHLNITTDRISFRIIVIERGKRDTIYTQSAGGFFVSNS